MYEATPAGRMPRLSILGMQITLPPLARTLLALHLQHLERQGTCCIDD